MLDVEKIKKIDDERFEEIKAQIDADILGQKNKNIEAFSKNQHELDI